MEKRGKRRRRLKKVDEVERERAVGFVLSFFSKIGVGEYGKMGASQRPWNAFSSSFPRVYRRAATRAFISTELEREREARRGGNPRTT